MRQRNVVLISSPEFNMKLYEKEILIPLTKDNKGLLEYFSQYLLDQIPKNEIPIRFVITRTDDKGYHSELGILSEIDNLKNIPSLKSIFDFRKRPYERTGKFNVMLVIPTGIDAVLGGHAGDAGALARLIASTCDTLITHPNVVNASDINELPENALYVEGSILSRLIMGTIGLQKIRKNRLLVIIDEHQDKYFTEAAINSVSAARACLGIDAEVIRLKNKFKMKSKYTKSGRAVGIIENLNELYNIISSEKDQYDALALSSVIDVEPDLYEKYYSEDIVNPWGGVEAILTHTISSLFNIPSAHSPMIKSKEIFNTSFGVVDPRKAAEEVSTTYFYSVLKGLHRAPKIITNPQTINQPGLITASDISCLVIPDKCLGLPTFAALKQGITVIAVKENKNIMQNNLEDLPWAPGQLITVENYLEAIGVITALKSGVSLESVRRPLGPTKVIKQ